MTGLRTTARRKRAAEGDETSMKKRWLTAVLVLCLLAALPVGGALAVDGQVGTPIEKTLYTTVTAEENGPLVLLSAASQSSSGITVTVEQLDDKTMNIYYEGTPTSAGELTFTVAYTDNGVEHSVNVPVSIVELPDLPRVDSYTPSAGTVTMKQSDEPTVFTVAASANGNLSYEWVLNSESVGEASSCTVDPSGMETGNHDLYCVIRNQLGEYVSGDAEVHWVITVEEKEAESLEIKGAASSAQIYGTGTVRFTVTASGSGLTYQWFLISGSSKSALKDGTYHSVTYGGSDTATLKISCDTAPSSTTVKYVCVVTDETGQTAETDAYVLSITEDASMSKITKIEVVTKPDKTEYTTGESLDTTGMKISAVSPKGTEVLTEGFVCDPVRLQSEGTQVINVSYGGKTTSFTVEVRKADHEHRWSAWEADEAVGIVSRRCEIAGCTGREIFTIEEFIDKYPTEAKALGLIREPEPQEEPAEEPEEDDGKEEEQKDDAKKEKKSVSAVLIIIPIVAALLLAAAVFAYFKLYRNNDDDGPGKGTGKKKKATTLNDMRF